TPPSIGRLYARFMPLVRAQLGEAAFAAAWSEGRAMSPSEVLSVQEAEDFPVDTHGQSNALMVHNAPLLMSEKRARSPRIETPAPASISLTSRALEVLRLVAVGLTSVQLAEQLVISALTVNTHVRSIYNKLGLTSRSAATRYAIE